MVDEVEIKNVGGRTGVASEATLAALVASLSSGNNARERVARLESAARERNTRGLNDEAKQRGILSKTIGGTISAVKGLATEFISGGNRMGDFANAMFGAQSSITGLVRAVDGLIDNYRELTSVGASFNNSMYDFIKSSAETGMSLGEYGNFILENSQRLRMLGGTVSEGTKRFGEISKTLRQNFGSQLTRVGMTMEDMNNILMEYTDYSISRMGKETRSNAQLAKGAAEYALELDKISKLTGLSRKQLAEEMAQQQADQRVRVAMNSMSAEQQDNFNRALAIAGNAAPELKDALVDMADGIPSTELAKTLWSTNDTFRNMAGDIENMSTEDFAKFMRSLGNGIDDFSLNLGKGGMEALSASNAVYGSIFGIGASLRRFTDMTDEDIAAMEKESASYDRLSGALLNFETALNNLKTFILEKIVNSEAFKQLEALGSELVTLFTDLFGGTGAGTTAKEGFNTLTDSLIGPDGLITGGIQVLRDEIKEFSDYLKNGGDPVEYLKEGLYNITSAVYEWFKDLFLGKEVMVGREDDRHLERQGGIFSKMVDAFGEFWDGPYGQAMADKIVEYFSDVAQKIIDSMGTYLSGGTNQRSEIAEGGSRFTEAGTKLKEGNIGGAIGSAITGGILGFGELDKDRFLSEAQGGIIEGANSAINDFFGMGTDDWFIQKLEALNANGIFGDAAKDQVYNGLVDYITKNYAGEDLQTMMGYLNNDLKETLYGIQGYKTGTQGFENFGSESMAALHGVEAVVPRNTQAGEFLSKYFTNDWNVKPQGQITPQPNQQNQETLVKHVNQLNNTMMLVLSELRKGNELEKKTLSSVKGLSGDLYRGL